MHVNLDCHTTCRYPKLMDKALQRALVAMAKTKDSISDDDDDGEGGEGEGGEGGGEVKWIHEFVCTALPGSRHQVGVVCLVKYLIS